MPNLRVFKRIARPMQRLGYIKRLIRKIISNTTSNLDNVGNDLVDVLLRKIKVPLNPERVSYIKTRLFDSAYSAIKEQADNWGKDNSAVPFVLMELQDIYLADPALPSQVGKLVKEDWRKYPAFGMNLGMIREGTYSITTRALTTLYLVPESEQKAFLEYLPDHNPLLLDLKQRLIFLYSLIENDGEVFIPLFVSLANQVPMFFSDRDAGNLLPEIYSSIISRYRTRSLAIDLRERLDTLEKSSQNIAVARKSKKYTGGSAREESSRSRLEPYVDIGLFSKPHPMKYEYAFSPVGLRFAAAFTGQEDSTAIEEFLNRRFFQTAALTWGIETTPVTNSDEIVSHLRRAWKVISSSSGYAPIEELALLAGIEALVDNHQTFEIGTARDAIIAYQKANPYLVRFTVDRMGVLAHAKFIEEAVPLSSKNTD